uniref:Uncharacterized protein n=1 Tax=Siphoviridae sp. ctZi05 TaxID=2826385 RepID=A0A8S5N0I1_9CAUD|nr:MAG TPA: hypothetical protein [Siphoviridae sp. ctZi05]
MRFAVRRVSNYFIGSELAGIPVETDGKDAREGDVGHQDAGRAYGRRWRRGQRGHLLGRTRQAPSHRARR